MAGIKPKGAEHPSAPIVTQLITDLRALVNDIGRSNPNMREITLATVRCWQGEIELALTRLEQMQASVLE